MSKQDQRGHIGRRDFIEGSVLTVGAHDLMPA